MASLVDSEAQFLDRLNALKVSPGVIQGLRRAGLTSHGALAYAHGQPGQPLNDEAVEAWVTQNVLPSPSIADVAMVNRLLFESQTTVLASLKEQVFSYSETKVCNIYIYIYISLPQPQIALRSYA